MRERQKARVLRNAADSRACAVVCPIHRIVIAPVTGPRKTHSRRLGSKTAAATQVTLRRALWIVGYRHACLDDRGCLVRIRANDGSRRSGCAKTFDAGDRAGIKLRQLRKPSAPLRLVLELYKPDAPGDSWITPPCGVHARASMMAATRSPTPARGYAAAAARKATSMRGWRGQRGGAEGVVDPVGGIRRARPAAASDAAADGSGPARKVAT